MFLCIYPPHRHPLPTPSLSSSSIITQVQPQRASYVRTMTGSSSGRRSGRSTPGGGSSRKFSS